MRALVVGGAVALASFFATQASAQSAAVSVELVSGAVRTCAGESRMIFTYLGGEALPAPVITASSTEFSATRNAEGYVIEERQDTPAGALIMRAQIRADGTIVTADFVGPARAALEAEARSENINLSEVALFAARDNPERLVMGRSFNVGDQLYPADVASEQIAAMGAAIGFPPSIQLHGDFQVPFVGVEVEGDRPHLVWEGALHLTGAGPDQGRQLALDAPVKVRLAMDAATGLVRVFELGGPMTISADGERVAAIEFSEAFSCTVRGA